LVCLPVVERALVWPEMAILCRSSQFGTNMILFFPSLMISKTVFQRIGAIVQEFDVFTKNDPEICRELSKHNQGSFDGNSIGSSVLKRFNPRPLRSNGLLL
jgi:hypothetical protein